MTTITGGHNKENRHKLVPLELKNLRAPSLELMEMSPALANFKGFSYDTKDVNKVTAGREGLSDTTNLVSGPGQGYINKIRRQSVSGLKKTEKKIPLVCTHATNRVSFKGAGKEVSKVGKESTSKSFPVQMPGKKGHIDALPMDIDKSPMVTIREKMTRVPRGVRNIDDTRDPFKCPLYAQDICDYLQAVERRWTFPANYLQKHMGVTPKMRMVLMDWLIQVQVHEDLCQHTLHMCVTLIDRYLCLHAINLNILQLVGITCLLIASKFYERYSPEIQELCHLTDNTYNKDQVLAMERRILQTLNFDLNIPDPVVFIDRFIDIEPTKNTPLIRSLSLYLLDMTIHEAEFVQYVPSLLAASAIYVSTEVLEGGLMQWDSAWIYYTKYSEKDLFDCSQALRRLLSRMSKYHGAHQKYRVSTYHSISKHPHLHLALGPRTLWPGPDDSFDTQQQETDSVIQPEGVSSCHDNPGCSDPCIVSPDCREA